MRNRGTGGLLCADHPSLLARVAIEQEADPFVTTVRWGADYLLADALVLQGHPRALGVGPGLRGFPRISLPRTKVNKCGMRLYWAVREAVHPQVEDPTPGLLPASHMSDSSMFLLLLHALG